MLGLTAVVAFSSAWAFQGAGAADIVPELAPGVTVYYNEACSDCSVYMAQVLFPTLDELGFSEPIAKDYLSSQKTREELNAVNSALGIPYELQSHLVTFVKGDTLLIFEGHVPSAVLRDALTHLDHASFPRLLVYDESAMAPPSYKAWAFSGQPQTYEQSVPLQVYLTWYEQSVGVPSGGSASGALLSLVLVSGFVDGLNPCAFAILLFFISFLYVIRETGLQVARMSTLYIYAIFVAYFLIGLGLLKAILFTEEHFMARLGAVLVIGLGVLSLLPILHPKIPDFFHMPKRAWTVAKEKIKTATLTSAVFSGFLVGLCTFPCSGGIYVAMLGMLAAQSSYGEGLLYLLLYNVMFVLPLIIISGGLVGATKILRRNVSRDLTAWERAHARQIRIASSMFMIALGFVLVAWLLLIG